MDRMKVLGIRWIAFQFFTQPPYVVVNGASARIGLIAPHFIEQFVTRDHLPGVLDQIHQRFELLRCENDRQIGRAHV